MLTQAQRDRIADYKRLDAASLDVNDHRDIFVRDTGEVIGYYKAGFHLALIDRPRGFASVEANGDIRFMEGRYYR